MTRDGREPGKTGSRPLAARLELHVRRLAGYIGERNLRRPRELDRAALYIEDTWRERGLSPRREPYDAAGQTQRNLIVETEPPSGRPFLLIGAHYDTAPGTPGADDNASGVAVLLELGARLAERAPAIPIRLAAFATEEPPHFGSAEMGSAHHARAARAAGERIAGMLSLEMLGYYDERPGSQSYPPLLGRFYPSAGSFLALVSDLRSRRFRRRLESGLRAGGFAALESASLPRWVRGVSFSDHASFWEQGYPAAMLTDTAMYRNPHYHLPVDLPETLDYGRMAALTEALASALGAWDQK